MLMDKQANERKLARNWIKFGMFAGILGTVIYFIAGAGLFPLQQSFILGFAIGPTVTLLFVGFYHFFKLHKKTIALQVSVLFGIISGTIFNMMIVIQGALLLTIPSEARSELGYAWDGLNMVQLGLDVSWDVYYTIATILLGVVMMTHPRFGKIWGAITLGIGAALLILNLYTYPVPPVNAGSVDIGPLSGLWYLIIMIRILTSLNWIDESSNGKYIL